MELIDLLDMDMGCVVDWIEDNSSDYKLVPNEPQWSDCDMGHLPQEDDQMYWVRNNLNGNIKLCYLMDYPRDMCWQGLDNTDFSFTDTSWIMIEKPEY